MKVVRVFRLKKFTSNLFREQIIRIDCKCNIEDEKEEWQRMIAQENGSW